VFVRASVTVTFAPAITAPEESVTVPRTVPKSVPCPKDKAADAKTKKRQTNAVVALYRKEDLPVLTLRGMYHDKKANATRNSKSVCNRKHTKVSEVEYFQI
jgi:hypothetical protein